MPMQVNSAFDLGQMVYLKHDWENRLMQITSIRKNLGGAIQYGISCGLDFDWFYAGEISLTPNLGIAESGADDE